MAMKHQDRVIDNPVLKDCVTLVKTAEATNGEYLLVKSEIAPHELTETDMPGVPLFLQQRMYRALAGIAEMERRR